MYGAPTLGYGCPVVRSFNSMVGEIRDRQVFRPESQFAINLLGSEIAVKPLPNGFIELDGRVQPVGIEREIEDAIKQYGAILKEILV